MTVSYAWKPVCCTLLAASTILGGNAIKTRYDLTKALIHRRNLQNDINNNYELVMASALHGDFTACKVGEIYQGSLMLLFSNQNGEEYLCIDYPDDGMIYQVQRPTDTEYQLKKIDKDKDGLFDIIVPLSKDQKIIPTTLERIIE